MLFWHLLCAAPPFAEYRNGAYTYSDAVPLLRSHRDALPAALLQLLVAESATASKYEKTSRAKSLRHGKASTHWLPVSEFAQPRTAIEATIARLYALDFPDGDPAGGIAGAEWWFQTRSANDTIGFHYDKDEGTASTEWYMKMPALSTVTYCTNSGAPTLILNQTTNRNGNVETPAVPLHGVLVYPRVGRHVAFRGNLQHGVVGTLGEAGGSGAGKRISFLVNWWDKKPIAPYCNAVSCILCTVTYYANLAHNLTRSP
jgi:hypothetical protein